MKVFFKALLYFQFVFVIFWQKEIGKNVAPKMLVNLTPGCANKAWLNSILSTGVIIFFPKMSACGTYQKL